MSGVQDYLARLKARIEPWSIGEAKAVGSWCGFCEVKRESENSDFIMLVDVE